MNMTIDRLINAIRLPEDAWRAARENEGEYGINLMQTLREAVAAHDKYVSWGISDAIYFDTMEDITVWCENCLRDFGKPGLQNTGWLEEHTSLRLFKLGRLQFDPFPAEHDIPTSRGVIPARTTVMDVHIQQGAPLDHDACMASYRRAYGFFRGMIKAFHCHSWLLSPELNKVLPEGSNILRFQKDFFVFGTDMDDRQCEERVFPVMLDDPAGYPEDTSLRRSVKARLLAGEKMGVGMGAFWAEEKDIR